MKRKYVESESLASVGYDTNHKVLEVEFNTGGVYQYFGVPLKVYEKLIGARSIGGYFVRWIRNIYKTKKVGGGAVL